MCCHKVTIDYNNLCHQWRQNWHCHNSQFSELQTESMKEVKFVVIFRSPLWLYLHWCPGHWFQYKQIKACAMANCGRPHTPTQFWSKSLRWRHNGHDSVSNHQPHHCLLNLYSDENQRKHQSSAWRHQAITWTSVDLPQNKILWHSFQAPVLSNQISLIHGSMSWCQYYVASKLLPCQWYFGPVITYGEPVPPKSIWTHWPLRDGEVVLQVYVSNWLNTLRPRQNGRHFADDIFKCIFLNENAIISTKISLNFVPKSPINNIPALV